MLHNVPERPVISNCGSPTEKFSEFFDHHLKPIMQKGLSYTKDFIKNLKNLGTKPFNANLVTVDIVGLYPSIPHETGLRVFREVLNKQDKKPIPAKDMVNMAGLVLKNKLFELNSEIKQVSSTAGTRF